MERFLAKSEIRRRLRVMTGQASADVFGGQTMDRHNEFIRLANEEVLTRRQWQTLRLEQLGTIEIAQRMMNYPTNCRAENVEVLAVWSNGTDATRGYYIPLAKKRIPVSLDTDPLEATGGDAAIAQRGRPTRYELKNQIELWKLADIEYLFKLEYTKSPALDLDTDISVVDAISILLLAAEQEFDHLGDDQMAMKQRTRAELRIKGLHAWQVAGEKVAIDESCTFDEDRGPLDYYNIDTSGRPG